MLARLATQLLQPAIDHWHGRHAWPLTLIVSVFAATYLVALVLQPLTATPAYVAIPIWILAGCALLTWQVVGTLRAVKENLVPPADIFAATGGYATILVAVILVAFKTLDGISVQIPMPPPQTTMSSATYRISLNKATASVAMIGELNYGAAAALADTLKNQPNLRRVILNSTGGHIFAARAIAMAIQSHKLDTHVENNCFSACTIAFIAGATRTLAPEGSLGFHRYAFASQFNTPTIDPLAEQERDRRFFRSRGVSNAFLKRMFDAEHHRLWRPSHATLRAAAVLTE